MYSVVKKKNKYKLVAKEDLKTLTGFPMASKNKVFNIAGTKVTNISISNKKLSHPLAYKKVTKKYQKLIELLTELLISDDDSGESCREALNQIERFRIEIKNKYREYLKQKELEHMSKQLITLQKEANSRLIQINNYFYNKENGKSR